MRFLRSKKQRAIKKRFKKTGILPAIPIGKKDGLYWYKCVIPKGVDVPIFFSGYTPMKYIQEVKYARP